MDKETERFYLESFLKILTSESVTIPDVNRESPDFVISIQRKNVGIELTDFHSNLKGGNDKPRRAIEETWDLLQKTIMQEVRENSLLQQTHGLLFFKNLNVPPKSLHKTFTNELIQLAIEMINSSLFETKSFPQQELLGKYLQEVRIKKCGCYMTWGWNHDFSWIGTSEEELIDIVAPKLRNRYGDRGIDELWLLVISGYRLSQAMDPFLSYKLQKYEKLNNLLERQEFDKVYLYQYMFNVIYEWPGWVKIGKESFVK